MLSTENQGSTAAELELGHADEGETVVRALTKRGYVTIGGVTLDCFVLEGEQSIFTQRAIVRTFGGTGGDLARNVVGRKTAAHLDLGDTIRFVTLDGVIALGRDVSALGEICRQIIQLAIDGQLPPEKLSLARRANEIGSALAKVALEALVHEATGYQEIRAGDYLRQRLQAFLRDDAAKWERRFGPELVEAISRLYGHPYEGGRQPRWLANIWAQIYKIVLGEDVFEALRERNPMPRFGSNHHQYLTEPMQGLMKTDLAIVAAIARTSSSPDEFVARLRTHFRREPLQLGLAWAGVRRR